MGRPTRQIRYQKLRSGWKTNRRIASGKLLDAKGTTGGPMRWRNATVLWLGLLFDLQVLIDSLQAVDTFSALMHLRQVVLTCCC